MTNKGKMSLKTFLYVTAAIFLGVCVYAFIKYVPISHERVQQLDSAEIEGPLKKAIDQKSTVLCDIESFWAKYDFWGDTGAVYASTNSDEATTDKVDESISCGE